MSKPVANFPTQPAVDYVPITPHDTDKIVDASGKQFTARGFYVGATLGNVVVITEDGTTRTIPVAAYSYHWVYFTVLKNTGTTATLLFAIK